MKKMPRGLRLYLAAVLVVSLALAVSGYQAADRDQVDSPPASAGSRDIPALVGTWTGTWEDTRYFVSGAVSCTINQDGSEFFATGMIDLTDLGLGEQTGSANGSLERGTLTFTFSAAQVGSGGGVLIDGDCTGSGTVTAPLDYGDFEFAGTATDNEIDGTFTFSSPSGGWGVVSLAKLVPAEKTSWGGLKARY